MSARTALLLVVVTLAGCGAPAATTPDGETRTDISTAAGEISPETSAPVTANSTEHGPTISVDGGRLAAEQNLLFQRVIQRRNVTVQPPERIQIVDPDRTNTTADPPQFLQLFGVRTPADGLGLAGQTIGDDWIRLNQSVATEPRVDGVLVHEYTHIIQNRRGATGEMFESGTMELIPPFGVERPLLIRTVREGAATYVADSYQRTHGETVRQGLRYRRLYQQQETAGGRYFMAPYWFGYRYVADRLADGERLESVYTRPPRTTEAIIHGYEPGVEPPANLSVTVRTNQWTQRRGRVGELGTRTLLSATLNRTAAASAAAGWGNDILVRFENGSATGYVWTTRWDDSANETGFRTALTTALDRRATRTDTGWHHGTTSYRVRQSDARTTVVTVGPSEFVRGVSVDSEQSIVVHGP